MSNIYKGTLGLIGNTPLVEVTNIEKDLGLEATLLVKLEYFNPTGSAKNRAAKYMLDQGIKDGLIDEIRICIAPKVVGGVNAKTLFDGEGFDTMDEGVNLELTDSFSL